ERRAHESGCAERTQVMSTMCTDYSAADRTSSVRRAGRTAEGVLRHVATRIFLGLKYIALWPVRVNAARRELEMLSRITDYELKDSGLPSSDLSDAPALPADASPTDFLATRVAERHQAKHA